MAKVDAALIEDLWDAAGDDFPEHSTPFIMQVVCDRYRQQTGEEIDHGHVAGALHEAHLRGEAARQDSRNE